MVNINALCEELKVAIEKAYSEGITIPDAERLAARTLIVRLGLADSIKSASIDSKMKKHGVKAIRGAVYMDIISKSDKKPTEAALEAQVNLDAIVGKEEEAYATAEADYYHLTAYLDVFKDAHIYFRGIAKGTFEG